MKDFNGLTRKDALALLKCYEASDGDREFVDEKFPNYQSEPDPGSNDERDVYDARLKVMSELQPNTVELIKIANATKDPAGQTFKGRAWSFR